MPMEEETIQLLTIGSTLLIGLSFILTAYFWFRNRKNNLIVSGAYGSLVAHLLLLSIAINSAIRTITFNVMAEDGQSIHPMASEEISLRLGATGLLWAGSMFCLMVAIFLFSISLKINKNQSTEFN
ncbi:hypothetical protein [Bacillus sp. AK128]